MASNVSPLAPKTTPDMPVVAGVRLATAAAGIRYQGRTDVMLAVFDQAASVAGVFTRSKCPSAPVEWCRARIKGGRGRALVVNSGNANAFTGRSGREACAFTAKLAAAAAGCNKAARNRTSCLAAWSGSIGPATSNRDVPGMHLVIISSGSALLATTSGRNGTFGSRASAARRRSPAPAGARQDVTRRTSRTGHRPARSPSATAGPPCRPAREP